MAAMDVELEEGTPLQGQDLREVQRVLQRRGILGPMYFRTFLGNFFLLFLLGLLGLLGLFGLRFLTDLYQED